MKQTTIDGFVYKIEKLAQERQLDIRGRKRFRDEVRLVLSEKTTKKKKFIKLFGRTVDRSLIAGYVLRDYTGDLSRAPEEGIVSVVDVTYSEPMGDTVRCRFGSLAKGEDLIERLDKITKPKKI